ncbi:MAG TPA: hypothetical protein VK152_00405 [Paludibacter sp.]|nr:hypothetical protein [Paludibacter sp.]
MKLALIIPAIILLALIVVSVVIMIFAGYCAIIMDRSTSETPEPDYY